MPDRHDALDALVAERAPGWIGELTEFCAIPSEAADAGALGEAASWVAGRLERAGARVEILEADGVPPLVVGEIGEIGDGSPTLVCVQHYDVQPADPLELWTTPPYEPTVRDGRLYARGASDNKGQLLLRIEAQLAHLRDNVPFEEAELKRIYGTDTSVAGRTGAAAQAAQIFESTCNLAGIWSGWTGPGSKTITPAQAHAKLDMRLVPDQDPAVVLRLLRDHLDRRGFGDIEITNLGGEHPFWTPIDAPIVDAAARAEEVFGQAAIRNFSSPGTAPMHEVCAQHDVPMVAIGCSDHRGRAPMPRTRASIWGVTPGPRGPSHACSTTGRTERQP